MRPLKGLFHGECFTPGCSSTAVWISLSEPQRSENYNRRYRCQSCCDAIAAAVDGLTVTDEEAHGARIQLILNLGLEALSQAARHHAAGTTAPTANSLAAAGVDHELARELLPDMQRLLNRVEALLAEHPTVVDGRLDVMVRVLRDVIDYLSDVVKCSELGAAVVRGDRP